MKLTKFITIWSAIMALVTLELACTKATGKKEISREITNFSGKTILQVYDATVGSASTQVFVDGGQVSGTAFAYGTVFPSAAYAFSVDAGLRGFSIRNTTAGTTQAPIVFTENLDPGKSYTIFMYDTSTNAKQITVENKIEIPSDTTARVKFANLAWAKSGTAPAVDVFSKLRNSNVFSNVLATQVTEYIPYAAAVTDSLIVREAGTMNALDTAAFNFTRKRSYTLVYRGRAATNEAGGAASPRTLSVFTNY